MKILSIIIPAYNEEKTIHLILDKIRDVELIEGVRKQVIIVNDHSSDQTEEVILKYKADNPILDIQYCLHSHNEGKGAAIRTGIQFVKGDFVIIQDADLEYDPNDYNLLLPLLLKGEKVVYGSRFLMRENKHSYKSFYLGGLLVTTVTNLLYNQNLTDEPTCYKAFQSDFLRSIPLVCTGFEFCPEVTAKVAIRGYKIKEVPIHYYPRSVEEGKKIKWTDGVEALWVLFNYYRLHVQQRILQACKKLSLIYLYPNGPGNRSSRQGTGPSAEGPFLRRGALPHCRVCRILLRFRASIIAAGVIRNNWFLRFIIGVPAARRQGKRSPHLVL